MQTAMALGTCTKQSINVFLNEDYKTCKSLTNCLIFH